jgi:hypothetical protein
MENIPDEVAGIVGQVQDLVSLYGDPARFGEPPAEDELIVHFVVPALRALGWPPERIGVKWNFIDVCVFDAMPRSASTCRFIVETKRLRESSQAALAQGRRYLESLAIERDVVVTDGICYRLYAPQEDYAPVAYANLARLKQSATVLFDRMRPHPRR